jgi:glycerophosphoryl diester phosphodiesterase
MLFLIEKPFYWIVDYFFANLPQPLPQKERLKHCKIVSHRGEYNNKTVFENTNPAFDRVRDQGVWGIELDIRWTKDLQPVVSHDKDLQRLFHSNLDINRTTKAELKKDFPLIPSLTEVIQRYGKTLHLMVEIKKEDYPDPVYQNQVLKDLFSPLTPQNDFHFLSLYPEMFNLIDFVPTQTFLPIAELNVHTISKITIQKNYRGILGHYLLLTAALIEKHHDKKQEVGTGWIGSKNSLFRELNRGVKWLFSNNAVKLQLICNSLLQG